MSKRRVKISDFAEVITGGTPSTANPEYWDNGDIPWLQSGSCQNGIISGCDTFITQKGLDNSAAKMMKPDSVLIALTGATTGKVGYLTFEACANQSVTGIQPNAQYVSKYLFYYLKGIRQRILDDSYGGAQKHISQGYVKNIEVPLGTISEQAKIAKILEQVDGVIAARQLQLQMLDDLIKARFVEMFGSFDLSPQNADWTAISEIGAVVGGSTPKTSVSEYWDGEYRWLSPAELKSDSGIVYDSIKKITKAGVDSCSLQELPVGTVILSSRAPIGKVAIAGNTFYCNQGFKNIICNKRILPRYLYTLLLFNTDFLNSLGRGATFKEISKSIVESIRIPLPSIEEQEQFTSFVAQVDKSKVIKHIGINKM